MGKKKKAKAREAALSKALNKAQGLKGKAKEAAGKVMGNPNIEFDGVSDQVKSSAKDAAVHLKDAAVHLKDAALVVRDAAMKVMETLKGDDTLKDDEPRKDEDPLKGEEPHS